MSKTTRPLSAEDKEAQRRLKVLWAAKKDELGLTQARVAEDLGKSQALIAHYLNGHTAIGPVATLMFARLLRCQPTDIRPDFKFGTIVPSELPPDVVELAIKLASVPEPARRDIIGFVNVSLQNGRYIDWVVQTDAQTSTRKSSKKLPASTP